MWMLLCIVLYSLVTEYGKYLSTKWSDNTVQPQQEHSYNFGMWSDIFLQWGTLLGSGGSPLRTHTPAREMDPSEGSTERLSIQTPTQVETKPPPPTHTHTHTHSRAHTHHFRYNITITSGTKYKYLCDFHSLGSLFVQHKMYTIHMKLWQYFVEDMNVTSGTIRPLHKDLPVFRVKYLHESFRMWTRRSSKTIYSRTLNMVPLQYTDGPHRSDSVEPTCCVQRWCCWYSVSAFAETEFYNYCPISTQRT